MDLCPRVALPGPAKWLSQSAVERRHNQQIGGNGNILRAVDSNLQKIERLLDEALQRLPEERAAFLDAACGGNESVRREVEALLAADAAAGVFLTAHPRADPPAGNLDSSGTSLEGPGTVIGRYKLLEQIGEGGFGVVYMAEQLEPVKRRVALKIIKPGMDSRQVIGRFEAERQALALMDHPNIARIYDAGMVGINAGFPAGALATRDPETRAGWKTSAAGRPYFVMELVRGIPITKFCEEQQLDLEARLKLFIQVCSAVQHAHQKGVIHRDLKPSNILVGWHGEEPVPKVIDFGIAKAIEQPLTDQTVFTQFQQFLGTPAYMSPEQASLSGLDVDTRSDIYSLGVLLYELLTGAPPFDTKELLSAGLDEMRRIIQEKAPARPSTRLRKTSLATAHPPLATRYSSLSTDLDWIVMKALEKDRARRYETANGLAADVRRYLKQEPVTAVAPTLLYQLRKFYGRNRAFVRWTCAFVVLLLLTALFSSWQAVRAQRAKSLAARDAATAENVSEFLWKGLLKQMSPWAGGSQQLPLRQALDVAAGQVDDRLGDQPLAEASVRLVVGKAYRDLSEPRLAETNLTRAVALRRAHLGALNARTAEALFELAVLRGFQGRPSEAERLFEEVVRIRSRVLGESHEDTLVAAANLVFSRWQRLEPVVAKRELEQMLARLKQHLRPGTDIIRSTRFMLGTTDLALGQLDEAYILFTQATEDAVTRDGPDSATALRGQTLLATTLGRQGRRAEAEALFREVIAKATRIYGAGHVLTRDVRLGFLQSVLLPQKRFPEAAQLCREVLAAEHAQLGTVRPTTRSAVERTVAAWQALGGGPGFENFRTQVANHLGDLQSGESDG